MKYISLLGCLFLICTGCAKKTGEIAFAGNTDTCFFAKNDSVKNPNPTQFSIEIVENSLDDTATINSIKISPKQTGNILRIRDYYLDTMTICFKKQNVKTGTVKIRYEF
jgi:hypothetical protein